MSLEEQIKNMQIQLQNMQCTRPQQQVHLSEITNEEEPAQEEDSQGMVDCIEAFQEDANDPIEVINACETEEIINTCVTEDEWFLDSGASSHVTGNPKLLNHMSSSTVLHICTAAEQAMPVAR